MPGSSGVHHETADIAWFFGDLTRAVARSVPVSHADLCATLDLLGETPPTDRPVVTVPDATVHFVSVDEWHRHALGREVDAVEELAAREVHRRMAEALGAPEIPPRSDPYVVPE